MLSCDVVSSPDFAPSSSETARGAAGKSHVRIDGHRIRVAKNPDMAGMSRS